jgi:hypothetical protein
MSERKYMSILEFIKQLKQALEKYLPGDTINIELHYIGGNEDILKIYINDELTYEQKRNMSEFEQVLNGPLYAGIPPELELLSMMSEYVYYKLKGVWPHEDGK